MVRNNQHLVEAQEILNIYQLSTKSLAIPNSSAIGFVVLVPTLEAFFNSDPHG
jgi:hypothetical protein